jgi:hypothetical protein
LLTSLHGRVPTAAQVAGVLHLCSTVAPVGAAVKHGSGGL